MLYVEGGHGVKICLCVCLDMHNNIHTHVLMYLHYGFISLFMSVHSCLLVSVNTLIIELGVSQEALKRRSMEIQCEE